MNPPRIERIERIEHAFPCAQTTTPVSVDFIPTPLRVRDWDPVGPTGFPLVVTVTVTVTDYLLSALTNLGEDTSPARYTSKPPRACPTQAWDPASHVVRDTARPPYSLIRHILRLPAENLSWSICSEACWRSVFVCHGHGHGSRSRGIYFSNVF
jgi:hypothetical protein